MQVLSTKIDQNSSLRSGNQHILVSNTLCFANFCFNSRSVTLRVCSVVDGAAPAICHVFASCFDWLVGFYSAIRLLQRPWTNDTAVHVNAIFWSNYSGLIRPHLKRWLRKGTPLISGKSRLVKKSFGHLFLIIQFCWQQGWVFSPRCFFHTYIAVYIDVWHCRAYFVRPSFSSTFTQRNSSETVC